MTDDELLHAALRGGETEWTKLHEICRDRAQAEALARMLERYANAENDAAFAWAKVLTDLHPGLKINLSTVRSSST